MPVRDYRSRLMARSLRLGTVPMLRFGMLKPRNWSKPCTQVGMAILIMFLGLNS